MILPGNMVFYSIYTKRASVVVCQCLSVIFYLIVILKFTGQVGLGVGSWPSNRATEGSNPK